jgi:hypothetical protein
MLTKAVAVGLPGVEPASEIQVGGESDGDGIVFSGAVGEGERVACAVAGHGR